MRCSSNKSVAFLLVLFLLLVLSLRMVWAQESEFPVSSSEDSTLSSLDTNVLWAIYFQTLTEQEALLTQDRLNWKLFNESMLEQLDSLMMRTLSSQNTARRASLALQLAKKDLSASQLSVEFLQKEVDRVLKIASAWKFGAIIVGGAALIIGSAELVVILYRAR